MLKIVRRQVFLLRHFSKKTKTLSSDSEDLDFEPSNREKFEDWIEPEINTITEKQPVQFTSVDFYDEEFQNNLREFCHYYQIPYLESNVPKTARNAAKIYQKMSQDSQQVAERFQQTKLNEFLQSLSAEDVDDSFNPFKLKEKWMKFFRGGFQRVQLNTDRVLKNYVNESLVEFINDQFHTFNDMQLVRAMVVLSMSTEPKHVKIKDKVFAHLMNNTLYGKFELKRGNIFPAFAQAINMNLSQWTGTSQNFALDAYKSEKMHSHNNEIFANQSTHNIPQNWYKIARTIHNFVPFMEYFFQFYKPYQKLVILKMMQMTGIYNQTMFDSFMQEISEMLGKKNFFDIQQELKAVCVTKHPVTNQDIDRHFELVDVIDFHHQHTQNNTQILRFRRFRILHVIWNEILNDPEIMFSTNTVNRNFKGIYQNLVHTSENSQNESEFYKLVLEATYNYLLHCDDSKPLNAALNRVRNILELESNLDIQVVSKLVALFQEKLLHRFKIVQDLLVKESFIAGMNLKSLGVTGSDEGLQIGIYLKDFKASFIVLNNLKHKLGLQVGDQKAWRSMQVQLGFLLKLQNQFNSKLEQLPRGMNISKLIEHNQTPVLTREEIDDLSNRLTPYYSDLAQISMGSDGIDFMSDPEILRRMRNECLIDYQAFEMNKRRLEVQSNSVTRSYSNTEGLLKSSIVNNYQEKENTPQRKSQYDYLFDRDGQNRKLFEEFEKMFDTSLTLMDQGSELLQMDNETFINIYNNSQLIKANEEFNIPDLFIQNELLKALEMPLYADGSVVVGHKIPTYEFQSIKSAAAFHSMVLNLKKLTCYTLYLQKRGELTQKDLQHLLDCFELIEPEHKLIALTQDLEMYRDLQSLNNLLKTGELPIELRSYDVSLVDTSCIHRDPEKNVLRNGALSSLSTLYFKKYQVSSGITSKNQDKLQQERQYLEQLKDLFNKTQQEIQGKAKQQLLKTNSLNALLGNYFHYIDNLMNNLIYSVEHSKIIEVINQSFKDQTHVSQAQLIKSIIRRDYSADQQWLQTEFAMSPQFEQEQLNLVLINQPILKKYVKELRQKQNSVSQTLNEYLQEKEYQSKTQRQSAKHVPVFPLIAEFCLSEYGSTTFVGCNDVKAKAKEFQFQHQQFNMTLEVIRNLKTSKLQVDQSQFI